MGSLEIPPGVVSTPTKKMNSSNYSEVNLVRWVEGTLQPVKGQEKYSYGSTFASPCRRTHTWTDNNGQVYIAYLCDGHCYVDIGGTLTNISPTTPFVLPEYGSTTGGYGDGLYSAETYGTPRSVAGVDRAKRLPPIFSIDNWGQQLVVMNSADGRLLYWDPVAPSSKLATVTGSPSGRCFVVTPERFVMMFGVAGQFNRVGWCDQENDSDWNFASLTNKAGFYDMQPANPFVTAITTKAGVLFFTTKHAYIMRFVGLPYIYAYDQLGEGYTPWSPGSVCNLAAATAWMSESGAWQFDGSGIQPIACPVRDWINDDVDLVYVRNKAVMVHVSTLSEVWWFFPDNGQTENTRCAIYNYKEGWWSQGRMVRTAGNNSSYTQFPIMTDTMYAYRHESGTTYWNAELPWVETYNLNINKGSNLMTVQHMIPDSEGDIDSLSFLLYYTVDRSGKKPEYVSTPRKVRSNGFIDFRSTGRDFRLRVQTDGPTVPFFTLGNHEFIAVPRGLR
jgi:hypothetical protein